jgi:hypothetical protein
MVLMSKDFVIFVVNSINNNFMYNIKYEIGLNEQGRPCIELPEDYEQRPEDRFFALEIARYMLQDVLSRNTEELDSDTVKQMDEAERLLGQLGDEVAAILYGMMRSSAELQLSFDCAYHSQVSSIEERDALPEKDIIYEGKIYDRVEGLRVYVLQPLEGYDKEVSGAYELKDGITNEHWVKI